MKYLIRRLKMKLKDMSNVLRSDRCIVITRHGDIWRIDIQCTDEELARFMPGIAHMMQNLDGTVADPYHKNEG